MRWISLPILACALLASPAMAQTTARLVNCHPQSCLLVSGHRSNPATMVQVNGHEVPVEGGRHWQIRLPLETVRAWSAPFARTLTIEDAQQTQEVVLPIGLLGHADLTLLIAAAR